MKKSVVITIFVLLAAAFLMTALFTGCGEDKSGEVVKKLSVATGSSLIASIVEEVGGSLVEVVNIVPPGMCPGHFDCSPDDIRNISDADIFIMHSWQGKKFSDELLAEPKEGGTEVCIMEVEGNWMVPGVRIETADEITQILQEKDPDNAATYTENNGRLAEEAVEVGEDVQAELEGIQGTSVLCSELQQGFVEWAGFDIAGTYGRPDELTPDVMKELVDAGKAASVALVIDNLQSGPDAGVNIAGELGVPQVTISNFPGGFGEDDDTWEKALKKNVQILLGALGA